MIAEVQVVKANNGFVVRNSIEHQRQQLLKIAGQNSIEIVLAFTSWLNNARVAQHAEVMTDGGLAELQQFTQSANVKLFGLTQAVKNPQTRLVGEQLEYMNQVFGQFVLQRTDPGIANRSLVAAW